MVVFLSFLPAQEEFVRRSCFIGSVRGSVSISVRASVSGILI